MERWGVNRGILAPAVQSFTELFFILFIHDFFRRKVRGFFRWFRVILLTQLAVIGAAWWLLEAKTTVNIIFGFLIAGRTAAVLYGLYASWVTLHELKESRRSPARVITAKILLGFFIAALVPMALENQRLAADIMNLNVSGFPWTYAFDLVLFAVLASITAFDYGNTANAKIRAERDLKAIEERLELGRSVQNMLFPANRDGSIKGADYKFFFESAQTMAGDWYYVWKCADGSTRLFVGDVTGKGPQAALAVAAIISVLTKHRDAGDDLVETITSLNQHLYKLFGGRVMSTMSVTELRSSSAERWVPGSGSQVSIYNCGTPGWIAWSAAERKARYLPLPSQQIGTQEGVRIGRLDTVLLAGDYLATCTDGCIDGSRAIKKLVDTLSRLTPSDTDDLFKLMIEAGKQSVQSDDRTALIVHNPGSKAVLSSSA
jgi:hypothetical protein